MNNDQIYNAAFLGAAGGGINRWIQSTVVASYDAMYDSVEAFATAVDAEIPTGTISSCETSLMLMLCDGVLTGRTTQGTNYTAIAQAIVACWTNGIARLQPCAGGSGEDLIPLSDVAYVDIDFAGSEPPTGADEAPYRNLQDAYDNGFRTQLVAPGSYPDDFAFVDDDVSIQSLSAGKPVVGSPNAVNVGSITLLATEVATSLRIVGCDVGSLDVDAASVDVTTIELVSCKLLGNYLNPSVSGQLVLVDCISAGTINGPTVFTGRDTFITAINFDGPAELINCAVSGNISPIVSFTAINCRFAGVHGLSGGAILRQSRVTAMSSGGTLDAETELQSLLAGALIEQLINALSLGQGGDAFDFIEDGTFDFTDRRRLFACAGGLAADSVLTLVATGGLPLDMFIFDQYSTTHSVDIMFGAVLLKTAPLQASGSGTRYRFQIQADGVTIVYAGSEVIS